MNKLTLPASIKLPQASPLAALLGGIGGGIEKGTAKTLESQLLGQKPMTLYQQLSTQLRAEEKSRKTENALLQTLLKLSEEGVIAEQDVVPISKSASKLIKEGLSSIDALETGMREYKTQSSILDEIGIGKYKKSKASTLKEDIVNSLQEQGIKNPTLINRKLRDLKWPIRERQDILKRLKGIKKEKTFAETTKKKNLTPDLVDAFLRKAGGDPDKAADMARKAGYEVS